MMVFMKVGTFLNKKQNNMTKAEKWKKCEQCGDYEYCAGNYGTDKCTGFIPGNDFENGYE